MYLNYQGERTSVIYKHDLGTYVLIKQKSKKAKSRERILITGKLSLNVDFHYWSEIGCSGKGKHPSTFYDHLYTNKKSIIYKRRTRKYYFLIPKNQYDYIW